MSTPGSASSSEPPRRASRLLRALAGVAALLAATPAAPEVFHAKDEALKLAFGDATVESRTVFLSEEQVTAVERRTGIPLESKLFTYYTGKREGRVTAHAVIDTHVVRTLPETFIAVLTPEGAVERVVMLAFYEPPEYMPPDRWLGQFNGRRLAGQGWRLGHDIHGISGATLTAHAIGDALRKILVLHELVIRPATAPAD